MSSRIGHKFFKTCKVGLAFSFALASGFGLAQESVSQLNTVLNIDALYEAVEPESIHGETAVELLQELQTKHYSLSK
jgi:carboxyl-terminal processing protease